MFVNLCCSSDGYVFNGWFLTETPASREELERRFKGLDPEGGDVFRILDLREKQDEVATLKFIDGMIKAAEALGTDTEGMHAKIADMASRLIGIGLQLQSAQSIPRKAG